MDDDGETYLQKCAMRKNMLRENKRRREVSQYQLANMGRRDAITEELNDSIENMEDQMPIGYQFSQLYYHYDVEAPNLEQESNKYSIVMNGLFNSLKETSAIKENPASESDMLYQLRLFADQLSQDDIIFLMENMGRLKIPTTPMKIFVRKNRKTESNIYHYGHPGMYGA